MTKDLAVRMIAWFISVGVMVGCQSNSTTETQVTAQSSDPPRSTKLEDLGIGGDFALTDHNGNRFQLAEHRGGAVLIFFGYTFCPDACPQMLSKLSDVYAGLKLTPGQKLITLYITVDPDRDTPEVMKTYLKYFASVNAIGLTGTISEIDKVVAQYGATYKKEVSTSAAGYLVSHSTRLFLLDKNGKTQYLFRHSDTPEFITSVVKQVWE